MLRAVLFDIDGTLVDTVDMHAEAWQRAFAEFGKEVAFADVRGQIGKGGDQLMPVFLTKAERDDFGEKLEKWRGELYLREYLPRAQAFPKVRELFERLRADGVKLALASSCKEQELDTYKALCRIEDLIEEATTSEDAERTKPHPDVFEAALEGLGEVAAPDVLVVGDSPYDAMAAKKIDLGAVGVLCGGFPAAELLRAGCHAVYGAPADLLERYDEWAKPR
ncbi:MAG: HAD family hydrolase [Polyangiaceae bacterium]